MIGIDMGPCLEPIGVMSVEERGQLKKVLAQIKMKKASDSGGVPCHK